MKPSLETKSGSVLITASSSKEEKRPDALKSADTKESKEKLKLTEDDIFEPREGLGTPRTNRVPRSLTGANLQWRHFETTITPKNESHLQFLQGCTSFEGDLKSGKLRVNIDQSFWLWIAKLDPAEIRQCYIDAQVVRGEASSAAADATLLIEEAQISTDWDEPTRQKIQKSQKDAVDLLSQVYAKKGGKKLVIHSARSKKVYAKTTEGDLKFDYPVYRRSVRFCKKLLEASRMSNAVLSHAAVKQLMKKDGHDGQGVVIAIDRLQRLYEKQNA